MRALGDDRRNGALERLGVGQDIVEVRVVGALGPWLDAISPTHFVFPGLFGPVRFLVWHTSSAPGA